MKNHNQLPILIEKDEDGFYVVECPIFFWMLYPGKND